MEASALPDGAEPARERKVDTQTLSKINQPEMGHLSRNQPCPSYGLDQTSFLVVGQARHLWRKAVEIRSADGEVLGTVKRGCPAWTNSFAWKVPEDHASGCRSGVDPNVFDTAQCQIPETEILYTDQWSGMVASSSIRVMDCHDDLLFRIYEMRRDIILAGYMIHSDFVAEDREGNIMGYCKLEGFEDLLAEVGSKNYSFVDLQGNEVARAERPLHWENGAAEHTWNVSLLVPSVPGTLSDTRVILVAVANNVLLHEETDWCSNVVFIITPVILTLTAIGCIAGLSAVYSYVKNPPPFTPPQSPLVPGKMSPEILRQIRPVREI